MAYNVSGLRILLLVIFSGGLCSGSLSQCAAFNQEQLRKSERLKSGKSKSEKLKKESGPEQALEQEYMPLERMQGLHEALNPDYRDWSIVNGVVAHRSGFLADFFKNHQTIELVARESKVSISQALEQEEFGYFYHEHFNLLKHLFHQQEQERAVQLAQGSKTFAHQIARGQLSDDAFAHIMGDVVAYAIRYDEVLQKNTDLVEAIKAVPQTACKIQQDHGQVVALLQEYAENERALDRKKTAELNAIKKEFGAKIAEADPKKRPEIVAEKKGKELEIMQEIAAQKEVMMHTTDLQCALQLVSDVRESLNKSLHAWVKKYGAQGGMQAKLCDRIKSAIDGVVLCDPAQELQGVQSVLKIALRSRLDRLHDGVVRKFDKKSAEYVRNFLHVLESTLREEIVGVKGLSARMIMAFVYEKSVQRSAVIDLYNHVTYHVNSFIAYQKQLLCPNFKSATDASLATSIADAAVTNVKDIELWYEQLVYELLMYEGRCHITHPPVRYKKMNFAIKPKNDEPDGADVAESKEVIVCFSDCTETALRSFMSELMSDGAEFDLSVLDALGVAPEVKRYFSSCCATYQAAHTQCARNEWAQLLAGRSGLIYKNDEYGCEVKAGVKNFLHALVQICGLKGLAKSGADTFTGDDVIALFTYLCDTANGHFKGMKTICLDSVVMLSGDEQLLLDRPIGDDEKVRMKLEFLVIKNDVTEKVVLMVMDGHAEFDVHKITSWEQSVGQKALSQLLLFLYANSGEYNPARNMLLDLLTQLGLQGAVQRVRESVEYKNALGLVYTSGEKILDKASYLLSFIDEQKDVQQAIEYLQDFDQ